MDSDDPVYCEEDVRTITAAALTLGKDEGGLAESLSNHSTYRGRRLKTNALAPGSLGRRDAWVFYQDTLHAPEWVVKEVKEGYIFPIEEEVPPTIKLENNKSSDGDPEFVWAELLRLESLG